MAERKKVGEVIFPYETKVLGKVHNDTYTAPLWLKKGTLFFRVPLELNFIADAVTSLPNWEARFVCSYGASYWQVYCERPLEGLRCLARRGALKNPEEARRLVVAYLLLEEKMRVSVEGCLVKIERPDRTIRLTPQLYRWWNTGTSP